MKAINLAKIFRLEWLRNWTLEDDFYLIKHDKVENILEDSLD